MKLNPNSTRPQTSDIYQEYKHPWYVYNENGCVRRSDKAEPIPPNPPTQQDIERAKFVDKTYHWNPSRDGSLRPREQRSAK